MLHHLHLFVGIANCLSLLSTLSHSTAYSFADKADPHTAGQAVRAMNCAQFFLLEYIMENA